MRGSLTPMNPPKDGMSVKSNMFSTIKDGSVDTPPQYNDFLNDIFTVKKHQAYSRREKNDKRTAFIGEKFKDVWAVGNGEMERRIQQEFEDRQQMNIEFLQERDRKRKELMLKTKEFQTKQMKEREFIENSDKKKQVKEFAQELKKIEKKKLTEEEIEIKKKEEFFKNKEDLFKQMEQKQLQNLNDDLMNRTDYKMNRRIIQNLGEPVLAPKDKRKPF